MYEIIAYLFSGSQFERALTLSSTSASLASSFEVIANVVVTLYGKSPISENTGNEVLDTTKIIWNKKSKKIS